MLGAEKTVGGFLPKQTMIYMSSSWKYFKKDCINNTVTCEICNLVLKYNKSTSVMHSHLKRHPLASSSEGKTDNYYSCSNVHKQLYQMAWKTRQQITGLLVNFIVKDIRPLAAVHREGFREMPNFFWTRLHWPVLCYTVGYSHASLWHSAREHWEGDERQECVANNMDIFHHGALHDFTYSGASWGWPAGDGQYLHFFRFIA